MVERRRRKGISVKKNQTNFTYKTIFLRENGVFFLGKKFLESTLGGLGLYSRPPVLKLTGKLGKRRGEGIRGQQKYRREGGPKIVTGWGVKIWLQGGGQLHGTGRG